MWLGLTDIGKKANPSHCSVFAISKDDDGQEILVQVHQRFLDGWEYTKQVSYIQMCVEYFGIPKMYVDNTRGEFEDRSLPRQCIPIVLSNSDGPKSKSKMKMAVSLAKMVEQKRIRLLDDDRFISQLLCVTSDLQAPSTPYGHGDSFISTMLAVAIYEDFYAKDRRMGISNLGNLTDLFAGQKNNPSSSNSTNREFKSLPNMKTDDNVCKICNKRGGLEKQRDGRVKCAFCFARY